MKLQIQAYVTIIFVVLMQSYSFSQCDFENTIDSNYNLCPGDSLFLLANITEDFDGYFLYKNGAVVDTSSEVIAIYEKGEYIITLFKGSDTNLIKNGSFSAGNTEFYSDYNYTIPEWPYPGSEYYSVGNSAIEMNPYWSDCEDASGDGNYLLVDGSVFENYNVWCQTVNIRPNLNYEFSFSSTSLYSVSPAIFEVFFNGQFQGSFRANEEACEWQEHIVTWNSNNQQQVEICIENINLEGFGNDFALDDIKMYGYCERNLQFSVNEINLPLEVQDTFFIGCQEEQIEIPLNDFPEINEPGFDIQWSTTNGNILEQDFQAPYAVSVDEQGAYQVEIIFEDNFTRCVKTETITVLEEEIDFSAFPTTEGILNCDKDTLKLRASDTQSLNQYQWYTDNGNIIGSADSAAIFVNQSGIYYLIEKEPNSSCADTSAIQIQSDRYIPQIGLPNDSILTCSVPELWLFNLEENAEDDLFLSWNGPGIDSNRDSIKISEEGFYTLTLTDSSSMCVNQESIYIYDSISYPNIEITSSGIINCSNDSVILSLDNAQSNYVIEWSTENGRILGGNNALQATVDRTGQYFVEVIDPFNNCAVKDSFFLLDDFELPELDAPDTLYFTCEDSIKKLSATSDFTNPNILYYWFTNEGNIVSDSSLANPEIDVSGNYFFTIYNQINGCSDTVSTFAMVDQTKPDFGINVSNSAFNCTVDKIILNVNNTSVGTDSLKFTWSNRSINSEGFSSDRIITTDTPGLYEVRVENIYNSCFSVDSIQILGVNKRPRAFDLFYRNPNCLTKVAAFALSNVQGGQMPYDILLNNDPIALNDTINIAPGNYIAQVFDANGCVIADTFQVDDLPIYSANIGPDITITAGDFELLIPQFSFDTSIIQQINWSPADAVSCDTCRVTEFIATQTTELELSVTTTDGCNARADILITVRPARDVFIPSAFSPNADNINDFFTVFVSEERVQTIKSLRIFNRWGDQVFSNNNFPPNDQASAWDGTFNGEYLDPAVFIYAAEVQFNDGTVRVFSGDVTLVK